MGPVLAWSRMQSLADCCKPGARGCGVGVHQSLAGNMA